MERGYTLHFEGGVCKILDNKNKRFEIAQVKMNKSNRSFPLNLKYATNIAMKVQVMIHGYGIEDLATSTHMP